MTAAIVLTATIAVGCASASAQEGASQSALSALSTCVQSSGALDAVFLIDTSASLRRTDPDDQRVVAAKSALAALASFGTTQGDVTAPAVRVRLAEFSVDYAPDSNWLRLDNQSLPSLESMADEYTGRNTGIDTDFVNAMAGARADLAAERVAADAAGTAPACQVVFLFTDGKYDIEPRIGRFADLAEETKPYAPDLPLGEPGNADQAEALGRDALCAVNGQMDALRLEGVTTIALSLSVELEQADEDFIRSMAEGASASAVCGDVRLARGAYLRADDLGGLIGAFNDSANRIAGGTPLPGPAQVVVCGGTICPEGATAFDVDVVMSRLSILADLGGTPGELHVELPNGASMVLSPDQTSASSGGVQLVSHWPSPSVAIVDASLSPSEPTWSGSWIFTMVGQAPSSGRLQIFAYTDVHPVLSSAPEFQIGQDGDVVYEVVDGGGQPAGSRLAQSSAQLTATISDPSSGDTENIPLAAGEGRWTGTWRVPEGWRAAQTSLIGRLSVTTPAGVELSPAATESTVVVRKPPSFPQLETSDLRLGSVEGAGAARGQIAIVGGTADGCVSVGTAIVDNQPSGADVVFSADAAASGAECVALKPGERKTIPVRFDLEESADGIVKGSIPVTVTSEDEPGRELVTDVGFQFEARPSVSGAAQGGLFALLLVLGVLVPLVLLWIANYRSARFQDRDRLRGLRLRLVVEQDGTVRPTDAKEGLLLDATPDDWTNLGDAGRLRRFDWAGYSFRAAVPRSPFSQPFGLVSGSAPCLGSSGSSDDAAIVALSLTDSWVFRCDVVQSIDAVAGDLSGPSQEPARAPSVVGELMLVAVAGGERARLERFVDLQVSGFVASVQARAAAIESERATDQALEREVRAVPVGHGGASTDDLDWDSSSAVQGSIANVVPAGDWAQEPPPSSAHDRSDRPPPLADDGFETPDY